MESLEDVIVFLLNKNLEHNFTKQRLSMIINLANSFNVDWHEVNASPIRNGVW